jgi:small GTP-binding protein
MALFNYAAKEITLKLVYYGPGLCGKTTNLQYLHETMSPDKKGKLLSLSTDADRTLFFDFMPVHLGKIKGFNIRFQLYTVPGQVRYNATRKLVLKGADAVVFVADSQRAMREANVESLQNMKDNLIANNLKPDEIPLLLQYNKRDLPSILSVEELDKDINLRGEEPVEAAAVNGIGVNESFQLITKKLLKYISKKHNVQIDVTDEFKFPGASAATPGEKAPVRISVPDKTESLLDDRPPAAAAAENTPSESAIEQDILRASMPENLEGGSSHWEGSAHEAMETTPFEESTLEAVMPAHESATSNDLDWEKAFGQPIGAAPIGQTELEKMLEEEEMRKHEQVTVQSPAASDDISSLFSRLREELDEVKAQQDRLNGTIKNIEKLLKKASRHSAK